MARLSKKQKEARAKVDPKKNLHAPRSFRFGKKKLPIQNLMRA